MADYINIEGKDYRVSHSFAALTMFAELTGRKTLEQMTNLQNLSPQDLQTMMYCALLYGELSDKRKLSFTSPDELGAVISIAHVQEYVKIFAKQMTSTIPHQAGKGTEVKKKMSFWRRLKG